MHSNTNIDESVKVKSWEMASPTLPFDTHNFFHKQASQPQQPFYSRPSRQEEEEYQLRNMDNTFKQLKSQQIQKLKGLKNEYEEIRRITTDYGGARMSNNSSIGSSGIKASMVSNGSRVGGANYVVGPREVQILELQKKQLQIMLQNSMKKIQQLLHSEMKLKKLVHELKLQKQSKSYTQNDYGSISRIYKKKEKQLAEQVKSLQLQRQNMLSIVAGLRQRVKHLQIKGNVSEHELRKMLQQKRNYQQLIRMQKDKIMSLELEFKREKRQFQIMEKDKNAIIQQLTRSRDIKESSLEKQLQQMNVSLHEEITVKEKRYVLLLQQLESIQKQKHQQGKEQEVRIVNQLLSKSNPDSSNQVFQQTINSIIGRLVDLQAKPQGSNFSDMLAGLIDEKQKDEPKQDKSQKVDVLQRKIDDYEHKLNQLSHSNTLLQTQNSSIRLELNGLAKKNRNLLQSQLLLKAQIDKLMLGEKKSGRVEVKDRGMPLQKDDSAGKITFLNAKIKNLEADIDQLNAKIEEASRQREVVQDQNRQLLTKVSRMGFQTKKAKQELEIKINMNRKQFQNTIQILQRELSAEREFINRHKGENVELKKAIHNGKQAFVQEITSLKKKIDSLQRQKNSYDADIKVNFNSQLERVTKDYQGQIQKLTTTIKDLSMNNKGLQQQKNRSQVEQSRKKDSNKQNPFTETQNEGMVQMDIMQSLSQQYGRQPDQNENNNFLMQSLMKGFT